jgi:hypothetical protein
MRAHAFFGRFLRGCGREFVPSRPWQRFYSAACRPAVARQREAERLRELLERVLPDDPGRFE